MSAEVEQRGDFSHVSVEGQRVGHMVVAPDVSLGRSDGARSGGGHLIKGSMVYKDSGLEQVTRTKPPAGSQGKPASIISVEVRGKQPQHGRAVAAAAAADKSDSKTEDVGPSDSASNKKADVLAKPPADPGAKSVNNDKLKPSSTASSQGGSTRGGRKKMKKGIFVSYSPDAGFTERKFVVETVKQFKENNLAEDIWFDKDERNTDSPCWFSLRMEAVERCRAAVLILSESYFMCPVSVYEGKALLERQKQDANSVRIYTVMYSLTLDTEIPKCFSHLLLKTVDLTREPHVKLSLAEKSSVVVGALMMNLEKHATIHAPPKPSMPPDMEFTGEYKDKKICQWSASDLQEWLFRLGIKEFYRQSLAENMVDGFLLMSMTDQDMITQLGIDSRVVRKKIMQQILVTLDKEHKLTDNWHLRARTQRPKPACIYLVYDPTDLRLAHSFKNDLAKKGLQVLHHQKLGQSKEEFLQLNGSQMALASHVLVLLTEPATTSPFVFHEVLFADWLGKKLLTAMFNNTWRTVRPALKAVLEHEEHKSLVGTKTPPSLRPTLKAILGDCPAIDFESKLYTESMDVLEHHIKPLRTVPGVILEQAYLTKMTEGIKPLSSLAMAASNSGGGDWNGEEEAAAVFISYQWDMQSRVEDIRHHLESNGISCWADLSPAPVSLQRAPSTLSGLSTKSTLSLDGVENLQSQIQRSMKAAKVVLTCITPKYMQSDNCIKDLTLADILHKHIVPVMLRFCPWPPEGAPAQVRKILAKHNPVDLSNEKLFKQNIHILTEKVRRLVTNMSK